WGSYYGGAAKEDAMVVRSDGNGNLCLAGNTTSANIPLVNAGGSYQSANQGGSDCFLAYIKREGVRRWATYLGGQGDDMIANEGVELRSSTVDPVIYVAGVTSGLPDLVHGPNWYDDVAS